MIIQSITQITSISRPKYLIILDIVIDNFLYYVKTKREILGDSIVKNALIIAHSVASGLFRWYFRTKINVPEEMFRLSKNRYVIVANHHKAVDPFLILATLPFNIFTTLLPIRFFTANIYLKTWWQKMFLFPFGCFRAYSVDGKLSGVKGGLYFSDKGQTLFIFPQGKRITHNSIVEPKIGIAYLARHRDFTILPVSIKYMGKRTTVNWGKPFKVNTGMKSKDLQVLATLIFNKVLMLSAQ